MKRCPECRRDYTDETLNFCLDDGSQLVDGPASIDEPATAVLHSTAAAGESRTQLYDEARDTLPQPDPSPTLENRARRSWVLISAATALILAAGAFYFFLYGIGARSPLSTREDMKFSKVSVTGDVGTAFLSPDGRFIARIVRDKNGSGIKLRQLSSTAEREILPSAKVDFTGGLIFSHDGNNVYYVPRGGSKLTGELFRISILGGEPRKLLDHIDSGPTLSPDGTRLAFQRRMREPAEAQLVVANEDGSRQEVIAKWTLDEALVQPIWSPDGKTLAGLFEKKDDQGQYYTLNVTDIDSRDTRPVGSSLWSYITSLRWLPTGKGILVTGKPRSAPSEELGQLWFVPFPNGEPQKVTHDANNYSSFTIAADGRTALVHHVDIASNVWIVPSADMTRARQITNSNSEMGELAWTPDGQIVYGSRSNTRFLDLWMMNSDGSGNRQLTFTPDVHEVTPAVSPDGRHIVYVTGQNNFFNIWRIAVDGSAPSELVHDVVRFSEPQFSPDSTWVFYNTRERAGENPTFWKIPVNGGQSVKLRDDPCRISPDATLFLCAHFRPPPAAIGKVQVVSAHNGDVLHSFDWPPYTAGIYWSPDGKALDFIAEREGLSNVWRSSLDGSRQQKTTNWQTTESLWSFAWSRDGKDLAVVRDSTATEILLIQNFVP